MNYLEYQERKHNGSEPITREGDVIEWNPPPVNFEFHSGVCVQSVVVADRDWLLADSLDRTPARVG